MRQAGQNGIYHIGKGQTLFGAKRRVLEGAVPPLPSSGQPSSMAYGWIDKGLAVPASGGLYVVEFVAKSDVRVLAYIDLFGRVFTTDEPFSSPPAREPDLSFAKFEAQSTAGVEEGCIYVRDRDGERVEAARYRCVRDRYALLDSWYDFGPYGSGLAYNDVMARAYLAFVHRPSLGAPAAVERGLRSVHEHLRSESPLAAMRAIAADVRKAENDPVFRPPALVRCLAQWLEEAGLDQPSVRDAGDEALRLVRTVRYAKTSYLALEDEDAPVPMRTIWALEAALNRFQLVEEAFGELATTATDVDCARWDAFLIETAAVQRPMLGDLADAPEGAPDGEWAVRCAISGAIERLRLPVRVEVLMQADVEAGAVALNVTVPDGGFMPAWMWREPAPERPAGAWEQASLEAREQQARRYALHLGLAIAAVAFESSSSIERVDIALRPFSDPASDPLASEGLEFPQERLLPAYVQVSFDRAAYEGFGRFEEARAGDPMPPYLTCGAHFDVAGADAFGCLSSLPSAALRVELPEARDLSLPEAAREALGSDGCEGVRVSRDGALRHTAEGLADRIVCATNASDAIRIVRAAQDEASAAKDVRAVSACTRLMASLAEGELDMGDQNAIVGRFLGEDRCLVALGRAKALMPHDPDGAVAALEDAVAEAEALDGFVDGTATVYRTFDSYASRVLYNRARRDGRGEPRRAYADAGKRVELASDSFYLCHLEIVRLLEHSFERTDEALRYGQRAIEIAPTTAAGYRQLGRAYMLVGDMENAAATLREGLLIAVQPNDIAVAYYQLAYVLWKMGRPQEGAACYLKSLTTSPVVAMQATAELQELVEEAGVALVPRDEVDAELTRLGVVAAPTEEALGIIEQGAVAAVDAGLFAVARNLLAIRLRYRADDALVNVLRSLDEPSS